MTLAEIKTRVAEINAAAGDPETHHGEDDRLRDDFIKHVSETANRDLRRMAKMVLSTDDLDVERWYA